MDYIEKSKYIADAKTLLEWYELLNKKYNNHDVQIGFLKQSECVGEYQEIIYERLDEVPRISITRRMEKESSALWIMLAENDINIKLKKGTYIIRQFLFLQLDKTIMKK